MKIRIFMKNPDCVGDALDEAAREGLDGIENLDKDEKEILFESRRDKLSEACSKWIEYDEYITVEIDTDANTAKVLPVRGN